MSKRHRLDTVLLAAALFSITGAVLLYNIYSSDGGGITVSLSELVSDNNAVSVSLISDHAERQLLLEDTVYTSAEPQGEPYIGTLLPPIVTPPEG